MLPSAVELFKQRNSEQSKDDPEGLCLPMGTPRKDPYPWQMVQTGKLLLDSLRGQCSQLSPGFLWMDEGNNPKAPGTWWGDSIGHWDGDALVVETTGFNDKAWLDLVGHPRTHQARITERFTRPELGRDRDRDHHRRSRCVFEAVDGGRTGSGSRRDGELFDLCLQ